MHFGDIDIENFMAVGKAHINLQQRGLLLIQGENEEDDSQNSNGAGKSTIADAISWCLFGVTARGISPANIVNRKAKKDCSVSVEINDDEQKYVVTRYRKHKKFKNSVQLVRVADGKEESLTGGTDKLTQEKIEEVLGCSQEIFNASVYSAQEAQVDLPAMTDKQLKAIVEEAAGITRLQEAYKVAREKLREAKQQYELLIQNKGYEERSLSATKDDLEIARQQVEAHEKRQREVVKDLEAEIEEKTASVREKAAALKGKKDDSIDEKIENIESNRKEQRDEFRAKQSSKESEVAEVSSDHARAEAELKAEAAKARKLKSEIENSESLIGQDCGECGKPYTEDDMEDVIAVRQKNLSEVMAVIKKKKPGLQKLSVELEDKRAELKAIRAEEPEFDDSEIVRLMNQKNEYKRAVDEVKREKESIDSKKIQLEHAKKDEHNPYSETVERLEKRLNKQTEDLKSVEAEIEEQSENVEVMKEVAEVYGNSGVRAHILDTVTPYLNQRTAQYLSALSDGNITATWQTLSRKSTGELTEKFTIDVESQTGGESFKALSGGEKRKVRLSTNLALQDLVSTRATKNIDLYIGDEIDHALDTAGLERLMNVLDERARTHGTVLVISHNELRDWIRQQVTVVKRDGQATLVE